MNLHVAGCSKTETKDVKAMAKRDFSYYSSQVDFSGKTLLDVGCGDGIKTRYFSKVSSETAAIDINKQFIKQAHDFAKDCNLKPKPDFAVADSAHLPFEKNHFQVVVCNDAIEHLSDCRKTILEMERVTAPSGYICINFGPPWRSPFGAHLDTYGGMDWYLAPWLHIIFSEANIKGMLTAFGKMKECDRHGPFFSKFLSKISIAEFETILNATKLKMISFKLLTPSPLKIFNRNTLREFVTTQVVALLQKTE